MGKQCTGRCKHYFVHSQDEICPKCGGKMIERKGFTSGIKRVLEDSIDGFRIRVEVI